MLLRPAYVRSKGFASQAWRKIVDIDSLILEPKDEIIRDPAFGQEPTYQIKRLILIVVCGHDAPTA